MVVTCLSRFSRLHYPSLSLVSKRFLSHLAPPKSCLYACLQYRREPNARWFTLSKKPTLTNDTTNEYVLELIQVPHSPPAYWSGLASVGSNIYNIGVPINKAPSSSVSVLDCRSNPWLKGPSMHVERKNPCASVVDGKIYVTGGCEEFNSSNWMEVFDPKTQSWELVSCPVADIYCNSTFGKSAVIEGRIYPFSFHSKGLAYTPKENKWETKRVLTSPIEMKWGRVGGPRDCVFLTRPYCVIDNKVYCYENGLIQWCDSKTGLWVGLKGSPKFQWSWFIKFADYGGKLAVFWDEDSAASGNNRKKMIWCVVIVLERRNSEEMWGEVEWLGTVLTVPASYIFWSALSATV